MDEQLGVVKMTASQLESESIPHMITRSTAMAFYSTPRMTRDIDPVVEMAEREAPFAIG